MAKYCRYCGKVMKQPKDRFCYSCRRSGDAVDRYYRKIKEEDKIPLTEKEQDFLRGAGMETMICAIFIIILFPLPLFIFGAVLQFSGVGSLFPVGLWTALIAVTAFSVKMFILGRQMYALKRKACGKKINIFLYRTFYSITHANSMQLRKKQAVCTVAVCIMEKFALGENGLQPEQETKEERGTADNKNRKCAFCGYENAYSDYSCKSCGKYSQ